MGKNCRVVVRRADGNQPELVETARAVGASVQHIHTVGSGCPDLIVGVNGLTLTGMFNIAAVIELLRDTPGLVIREGANLLVEVKNGDSTRLTPDEAKWHQDWRGQVSIERTSQDMVRLVR